MTGRWNDAARLRRQRASRERRRGKKGGNRDPRSARRTSRKARRGEGARERDRGVHARATPLRARERTRQGRPTHSKLLAPSLSLSSASRERPLRIRKRRGPEATERTQQVPWTRTCRLLTCERGNRGERDEIWILLPLLLLLLLRSFVCLVDSRDSCLSGNLCSLKILWPFVSSCIYTNVLSSISGD